MRQSEVLKKFAELTECQKERIWREVDDLLVMNRQLTEEKPDICPKCGQRHKMVSRGYQRGNGKHRYTCTGCGKTMTYDACTIMSNLKISKDQFIEICRDTLNLVSIVETASRLDLSVTTVHLNRHKFLSVLEEILESENATLSGTVEIDETYELESSKGTSPENRKARKRGEPSHFRGISHEQVCIVTTTDRNEHEIFRAVGYGRPTTDSITEIFAKRIRSKSILYSDGASQYIKLSQMSDSKHVQLSDYDSYNIVEHLNTVNTIHKLIKDTMSFYRGIATKYMNRYMALFTFMRRFAQMDDNEKIEILIRKLKSFRCHITRRSLKTEHIFSV